MKKIISIIIVLSVVCNLFIFSPFTNTAFADDENKITVNGKLLELDVAPIIILGRMLVPIRAIFEALGATVQWDENTKTVTGTKDNVKVVLMVDSTDATVNGISKTLDVPATNVNGRVVVPLRFIAESLDAQVNWNAETKTVEITTKIPFQLESLKLYESGYDVTPQEQRVYQERFAKSTTRYICWELTMDYPLQNTNREIQIRHVYYSYNTGSNFRDVTITSNIDAGWSSSTHVCGSGWVQPGNWEPGAYRLDLYVEGTLIGSKQFVVYDDKATPSPTPTPSPTHTPTPKPSALKGLKFYESGYDYTPQGQRHYATIFIKSTTWYVNWELTFEHPNQIFRQSVQVRHVYYSYSENAIINDSTDTTDYYIEPHTTSTTLAWGTGYPQSGNWKPGMYRVDVYINGTMTGSGLFEISDGT